MLNEEKIKKIIEEISEMLSFHGGYCELVKIEGKKVFVSLKGACEGCLMKNITLKNVVETILKEEFPEIEEVIEV